MTLIDLQGKALYSGGKKVVNGFLNGELIYGDILRYNPSLISPLATLTEFDYTTPDGARLTTAAPGAPNHRFVYNRNSAYLGPVDSGQSAVFEYILKKPTYISGLRSIVHLDLTTLSSPLFFNLYQKSAGFSMEYYWDRSGSIQNGDSAVAIPSTDEFIIVQFIYTKLSSSTSFSIYINGKLDRSGVGAKPITATAVHKGLFNYASVDAGLMTSMTAASAGADVYEMAVYDLKDNVLPSELIETNYQRAQKLYNT